MKRFYFTLFSLCFHVTLYSQYEYRDCIIVIDGKLPLNSINGYISYQNAEDSIPFFYFPGKIMFSKDGMNLLNILHDTSTVSINLIHTEFFKHQQRELFNYVTKIPIELLRTENGYLVFNITNFKKQKEIYYFDYLSSRGIKKWEWEKNYGNRKCAYRKIRKFIPDIYRKN